MNRETNALPDFLAELKKRISGQLRDDTFSRTLYSTDASIYQVMPHAVLIPQTTDDVHAAVELAAHYQIPITPRTAGSSLAGQATNEALIIDFTRHLDQLLEVNQEEQWVRLQPGLVLDELNQQLRPFSLQFGPDPASSNRAAMGGIVSNNSTGSHSILYGMTADHVLGMNVILSDGTTAQFGPLTPEQRQQQSQRKGLAGQIHGGIHAMVSDPSKQAIIWQGTPRHWRRCGGYNLDRFISDQTTFRLPPDPRFNLAKLVCGAEGTLAVITELKLNLVPVPKQTALAIIHFDDLRTALTAVSPVLEVDPSAVELLDNLGLTMCRDVPEYARLLTTFIEGNPNCVLITEFYGESTAELLSKIDRLKRHIKQAGVGETAVVTALDPQQQQNVWTVRKVGLGLLMSIKGDHKPIPFIEDAAVPVEHLAEYVLKVEQFCHDIGTDVAYYAHASAGCVHIRPLVNTKDATEIAKLPQITEFSVDLLRGYGGSFSSEHGDGKARSWLNQRFFGPDLYGLYQDVKQLFDPHNLLNPGNVVNAPPMTENLRYGADYTTIPLTPQLNFDEEHGFHRAVEMCNGAGICRKKTVGTMCPSFMVTREEEHSTRGRANLLRAAMSGRLSTSGHLPDDALTSPRLYEAMALCISCKACKAECPSSVDMAKIKFEYLAQYHQANGTPLRDRLFGNIATVNKLNSGPLATLVNRAMNTPIGQNLMQRAMGLAPQRTLPPFASQPFTTWFRHHAKPAATRQLVLFNDTFNTYNDPHIAIAATELLEAAGFEIILPGHGCCGRPMISKGLVDAAQAAARDTVKRLAPLARRGLPIVGLEPSCILSLRDEYLYLLPDSEDAKLVAQHALTLEEFISQQATAGTLNLTFTDEPRHILLHGHCHQKALVGTKPSHHALTLPTNYTLTEVDSGCCGMAGSFGYEAEHYDVSMQMAERRLLPAVRQAGAKTIIVAAGTSCRHQIEHGSEKRPLHPAELLHQALV